MRNIKIIVFSFLLLAAILQLIAFLMPSTVKVSRAIDIKAQRPIVKNQLSNFKAWKNWTTNFSNLPDSVIATDGLQAANGGLFMIMQPANDSTVPYLIELNNQRIEAAINLIQTDSICTVQWQYQFKPKWYAWEKYRSLFADNLYGSLLDSNLTALKKYVEAPTFNP